MSPSDNGVRPRPNQDGAQRDRRHASRTRRSRTRSSRKALAHGVDDDFLQYPYPETERIRAHVETLPGVTNESKGCIANLLSYRAVRARGARFPRGQHAAVLVPLFVGRSGDLYVVLSRRSEALRAFAGDTALPGGKVDVQDGTVECTARREAFEEIGLPEDKERVPLLCIMEPHVAKGEMLVTPVVVLILDYGLQPNLNSSEVMSIFAQPLVSFLLSTPQLASGRVADPNNPYHSFTDFPWDGGSGAIRLHRFLTGREAEGVKPVFGLTASILIKAATIGYGRAPEFEVEAPNAPTMARRIAFAFLTTANPLRVACEREGIDADETAARVLRPPAGTNAVRTGEWRKIGIAWRRFMSGRGTRPWHRDGLRKRVAEDQARVEESSDSDGGAMPILKDVLGDKARDGVDEQMQDVGGGECRLTAAHPRMTEQVEKEVEAICKAESEFDPEQSITMPGRDASRVGDQAAEKEIHNEWKSQGLDDVGKGGDGYNPEQTRPKKRSAKL